MSPETSMQSAYASGRSRLDGIAAAKSAGVGVLAFLASYVVAFVVWTQAELPEAETFGDAFDQAIVAAVRDNVPTWKAAGMALYNAHLVDVDYQGPIVTGSMNLIDLAGGGLLQALYVVPPLVLLLAGFAAARVTGLTDDLANAAVGGALVAVGYLVLAVLGTVLFGYASDGASLSIPLPMAVVFAGIVYPVLCGAAGGVLSHVVHRVGA
ncbi:transporter [Haloarchaeobius sp. HRN-SO-5]|uniref:transporter n=1 Tax=Haloarchaeobius sp. HRN-SO-5 TaxID=3446118 RepID=UPI003EBEEA94